MKRLLVFAAALSFISVQLFSQVTILKEQFGVSAWTGNPAEYPDYTSDAVFGGDDPHHFAAVNSDGYAEASGDVAVLMGNWNTEANITFVMQCNTQGYSGVRLSFGIQHNSNGWGTCQLTNNFTEIEYSTDSASWTTVDKASLAEGSNWPCADDGNWAFVELAEELPSSASLYIRFTHTDPDIHPYYLDDITLTGYSPDNDRPTAPSNLTVAEKGISEVVLLWNKSVDDSGINYYEVYKNDVVLMTTSDTVAEVRYQRPGSSAEFKIMAFDVGDNRSDASNVITVDFDDKPVDFKYSWQDTHANILPGGDIQWKPSVFEYEEGTSVRYIDYEGGDDANDGMSKATPWKHHPWDDQASGNAAAESGIHTYVFKRGVVYRGTLDAKDSGTPVEPIRLTSDPSWGTGKAYFLGSVRIEGGWTQADATVAPNIPEPEKVWYTDISLPETKMVVEMEGEDFRQLHVARSPNYRWDDDDILTTWWTMTGKTSATGGGLWLTDKNNLVQDNPAYYAGATIFSQEDAIVMCSVWKQDVEEWDPDNDRIKVSDTNFGGIGSHYFIENTPFLLDTVNEFYYDRSAQRLYIRLEGEKDPNTTIIEAASKNQLIKISSKHDIEISGLTFGVTTAHGIRYSENDATSVIRMSGICSNINITHNEFYYVNGGISLKSSGSREVNSHGFTVADNDFRNMGDHAIIFASDAAYIDDVNILRNYVFNSGYRHQGRWYSSIPAIYGKLFYGEVAGNVIDYSFGNGIDMFWGKGGTNSSLVPFVRGLIHQNKANHTLIGTNDYGGIESWQGGPTYCYNNYSHDGGGYKHYNNSTIGYAYYFDGSFKHYVFNNIASGASKERNSAAIMQVLNYYNMFVHNTSYNISKFFNAWKGTLALNGHNMYLANISADQNYFFKHEIAPEYIPFESYGYNVTSGSAFRSTLESLDSDLNLNQFRDKLESYRSQLTETGVNAAGDVLKDPAARSFDLLTNTEPIGRGVKFFSSFPLARVVGEWNFYIHPADSGLIMAENFYMTEDFNNRDTYEDVPMNHLRIYGYSDTSFVMGDLEDWTSGALLFDGAATYGMIEHSSFQNVKSNNLDMTTNNFIVEAYFKTAADHTGGVLVAKRDASSGYAVAVDDAGMAALTIMFGGSQLTATSDVAVNDGLWHHLLAEVDRAAGVSIYIDGTYATGVISGDLPAGDVSLSNAADFYVGREENGSWFSGVVDFLRVSKGSLYEAHTTIDELYTWQTDGPFLYDMRGNAPVGQRDAGALEATGSCDLALTESKLTFPDAGGEKIIKVISTDEILLRDISDPFISLGLKNDTVVVTVEENTVSAQRTGSFTVVSCNRTIKVSVNQEAAPCNFSCDTDSVKVDYQAQSVQVSYVSNGEASLSIPGDAFFTGNMDAGGSSFTLVFEENVLREERSTEITLTHCNGKHVIGVLQNAAPCQFTADTDTIRVNAESQAVEVAVQSNDEVIVDYPLGSFIAATLNEAQDKLSVDIQENTALEERYSEIILYNCGDDYTIAVIQEGAPDGIATSELEQIHIFPNPVTDGTFRIAIPAAAVGSHYTITDMTGKIMQEGFLRQLESELSLGLDPGMYVVELYNGGTFFRGRFIVAGRE